MADILKFSAIFAIALGALALSEHFLGPDLQFTMGMFVGISLYWFFEVLDWAMGRTEA